MWEVLLDALKDSAIALPFLLIIYLFIEFVESNAKARNKTVGLLNSKLAPLVAGGVGLIPQCGFSVIATDLYCQNYLKLGTLIAFFVATSDEALPILLTNGKTVGVVWLVVLIKISYAVFLGFVINCFDKRKLEKNYTLTQSGCCHHDLGEENAATEVDGAKEEGENDSEEHAHCESEHAHASGGKAQKFWNFVKHPLLHTLKIFSYIFVVNAIFGLLLYYAEQPILEFVGKLGFFQCFIVALVGLVPNCASSVIITGMYTEGIIGFSAMMAGLVSNSGIALAILFKQKKWKRNFLILLGMYLAGVVLGIAAYFVEGALA